MEIAMVRGLVIRISCILFGVFPVGSLLHLIDASSEFAGLMVIFYAVATANYLAYYCVKHQDEIPTRPERP
jgi:hypothetical protein